MNAEYDPVVSQIAAESVCKDIFVRAYAEPKSRRRRKRTLKKRKERKRPTSWFEGRFFVFDTETVNHELTFGAFEFHDRRKLVKRAVFYRDDLPTTAPVAFNKLQAICRGLGVPLYSLAYVFSAHIWRMRKRGGTFTGFNISYDLSRIASGWEPATATSRRGSSFINGFTFTRTFSSAKGEDGEPMLDESDTLRSRIVKAPFVRIRRDDRHHVRYDMYAANVLDLARLASALTDRNYSLKSACEAFRVEFEDRPGAHDGTITEENVAGCLYDVRKTGELLYALGREYDRHPIDLPPWRAQSGASIAKAYLRAFGVAPRLIVQSDFPKDRHGEAASAYFGGRVEARIVGEPMPCVYLDAVSMYPTIFTLLDLWFGLVIPERLEPEEIEPKEGQALLRELQANPKRLLDPKTWPRLAFFAQVDPNGAMLPSRPEIPSPYFARSSSRRSEAAPSQAKPDASHRLVSIGSVESEQPLWYGGPDLANAMISGAQEPRILRAWRLRPVGVQSTLQPLAFRGEDEIDPRTTNPFQRLIELRKRQSGDPLDDNLRSTGYKVIANSGAYGIFAETTPEDVDPDSPRSERAVDVWGLSAFRTTVDRPEAHGENCFFPIASLVTAGARLLLGFGERLVRDAGGEVAYCDTDSLIVVAKDRGGFATCTNGPYRAPDGSRAVRALSWREVNSILDELAALNVYNLLGSSFKLEDQNFDEKHNQRELWFFGSREKSYALYTLDAKGEPVVVKHSAHTIGQYCSPISGDRQERWIVEAWTIAIRGALGLPVETPTWFNLPALSQLTLTTWSAMKPYAQTPGVHPFDFLAVAQVAFPGLLRCCHAPRPSCPLFPDPERWAEQLWRCLTCGASIDPYIGDTGQPIFKTYGRVVGLLTHAIELKRLCASGEEPSAENMRGFTIPRPVRVASVTHVGKEIIVDPTDTGEGLTAELLDATSVVEYRDPGEQLDALRAKIKAIGISSAARASGISRSQIKAFVNQGKMPHASTVRKLEASLQ